MVDDMDLSEESDVTGVTRALKSNRSLGPKRAKNVAYIDEVDHGYLWLLTVFVMFRVFWCFCHDLPRMHGITHRNLPVQTSNDLTFAQSQAGEPPLNCVSLQKF